MRVQPASTSVLLALIPFSMGLLGLSHEMASPASAPVVILYSLQDPDSVQTACPEGSDCLRMSVEEPFAPSRLPHTVIVAGHSLPPYSYLNHNADEVAKVIVDLDPSMIVLDTCYGMSLPLLSALASRNLAHSDGSESPLIVGATRKLPPSGLEYDRSLFQWDPPFPLSDRVRPREGAAGGLERWRLDSADLSEAQARVDSWTTAELVAHLKRRLPNLVLADLPGSESRILIPVEAVRFSTR